MRRYQQRFFVILTRVLIAVGVCGSLLPAVLGGDACCDHAAAEYEAVAQRPLAEFRGLIAGCHTGGSVALPTGETQTVRGNVQLRLELPDGTTSVGGRLDGIENGTFFLDEDGNQIRGMVIWPEQRIAYRYSSRTNGTVVAERVPLDDIFCVDYPRRDEDSTPVPVDVPPDAGTGAITAEAVPSLQSRPEATAVIYLDMDGETVIDSHWNSGNPIVAASPNLSSSRVRAIWQRVSEDYRPFHINVTTDEGVYLGAPQNRRIRCIITPTGSWYGNAGGVAYVGSFRWSGDTPCWVFMTAEKSASEAASHEVGHTVGLTHDGKIPNTEYYSGHGSGATGWAPIMGVGYSKELVQWSKGEYAGANNTQNDLSLIAGLNNGFGYRTDDHGNNWSTATVLPSGPFNLGGVIEKSSDVDAFLFSVGSGDVSVTLSPAAKAPNLDILAEIRDSSNALVASSNPSSALNASFARTLPYGTYVLLVSGTGKGDPLGTGYTDYGSLGEYTLSGTIIGMSPDQVFPIDENPVVSQLIGRVETLDRPGDVRTFSIRTGTFSSAFSIDNLGDLRVADAVVFDYEARTNVDVVVHVDNLTVPALSQDYPVRASIQDVDEAPVFSGIPYEWYVRELVPTGTIVGTVHAVDPELSAVDYAIVGGNEDGFFSIDTDAGSVRRTASPGMTAVRAGPVVLQVRASDGGSPAHTADTTANIVIVACVLDTPSMLTYHVAAERAPRGDWTGRHFDDSAWQAGTGGIGYDTGSSYDPYVGTDVQSSMHNRASSLYVRYPFEMADAPVVKAAYLGIRYDDGFVAYLNGREIARRNAPADADWDATATADRPSTQAVAFEYIPVPSPGYLSDGLNILAIHGLNDTVSSTNFLVDPVVEVTLHARLPVRLPGIAWQRATDTGAHRLDYEANVTAGGEVPSVTLYWGARDGGTDPDAWQSSASLGNQAGEILHPVDGLMQAVRYYARIRAVNSAGTTWATDSVICTTRYDKAEFVLPGDPADYWVPNSSASDATWMLTAFSTQGWSQGYNAIGYERDRGYEDYLLTDAESGMYGVNASVYVRIPFRLDEVPGITGLQLDVQYDDAFVAYLNGNEIARGGEVDRCTVWNCAARADRPDSLAVVFEPFDVSQFADTLVAGDNVLAIHGMNRLTADSDMLVRARLTGALRFRARTYEQWLIAEVGLPEASSDPYDDPDGDGWFNLLEYVLGGDPNVRDIAKVAPRLWAGAGHVDVVYRRRANFTEAGISYLIQSTPDLTQPVWSTAAGQPFGAPVPDPDGISETVTVRFDATDPEHFYRVSATVSGE